MSYIMSNRYNINLINTKTGESHYHQLFGNNDWFDTFKKYLNSIGANTDGEWVKETKIPDLLQLIKAIDETVWSDIITNGPITKSVGQFGFPKMHSPSMDFTPNLIRHNPDTNDIIVDSPIYQITTSIANQSYLFSSYSLVNWLEKCNAIEDINIRFTNHSYLANHLEPISLDYKGEPIIIGNLKPEFELTISWD